MKKDAISKHNETAYKIRSVDYKINKSWQGKATRRSTNVYDKQCIIYIGF